MAALEPGSWIEPGPRSAGLDSRTLRVQVAAARELQSRRWGKDLVNSDISASRLIEGGRFSKAGLDALRRASRRLTRSGRGFVRALRVARTVADLAGEAEVGEAEVLEALSYRDAADGARES